MWAVLAVPCVAVIAWLPYLMSNPRYVLGPPGLWLQGGSLWQASKNAVLALVWPAGMDGAITVRSAAMHPLPVLLLAVVGVCYLLRRPRVAVFVVGGFLLGIAPAAATAPSAHRMIMCFPFLSLAAAYALDRVAVGRWRIEVLLAVATAGPFGVSGFSSPKAFGRHSLNMLAVSGSRNWWSLCLIRRKGAFSLPQGWLTSLPPGSE